jgi:Uncharacterized conserved protein (DUF2278)
MFSFFRRVLGGLLLAASLIPLRAQLPNYGYVVGTFVPGSNFLEPLDQQGKFLHYHFKVQTTNGQQYECVVDVKNGHKLPFPYRILSIAPSNGGYGPIFTATNAYHPITMTSTGGTAAQGALDYIRHPGILRDLAGHPWSHEIATPTADPNQYLLPDWDALFTGVQKIYAFGEPFTTGTGLHVVHQNQADKKASFASKNGTFQDGGVVFEYAPTASGANRKLLMVRFDDQPAMNGQPAEPGQSDFSYTTDPDGPGPLHVGQAATLTTQSFHFSGYAGEYKTYGPFSAEQFEVITDGSPGSDVDIFVGHDWNVSDTHYDAYSRHHGTSPEFVRSFGTKSYYVFVKAWNDASATVTVSYR